MRKLSEAKQTCGVCSESQPPFQPPPSSNFPHLSPNTSLSSSTPVALYIHLILFSSWPTIEATILTHCLRSSSPSKPRKCSGVKTTAHPHLTPTQPNHHHPLPSKTYAPQKTAMADTPQAAAAAAVATTTDHPRPHDTAPPPPPTTPDRHDTLPPPPPRTQTHTAHPHPPPTTAAGLPPADTTTGRPYRTDPPAPPPYPRPNQGKTGTRCGRSSARWTRTGAGTCPRRSCGRRW